MAKLVQRELTDEQFEEAHDAVEPEVTRGLQYDSRIGRYTTENVNKTEWPEECFRDEGDGVWSVDADIVSEAIEDARRNYAQEKGWLD